MKPLAIIKPNDIPVTIRDICQYLRDQGGQAWLVGGSIRDLLLGATAKDYDLEIYGLDTHALACALRKMGHCEMVGKQFGVHKLWLNGMEIDVALPRTEFKQGHGHRGFAVQTDPNLSTEIATLRRDFTINAMMFDPLENKLLDFHGGQADLHKKILRHVSSAFSEDPLRPLRAMQFAARFELTLAPATAALCRMLQPQAATLPASRIWQEWRKWVHAPSPSFGLTALKESGWLTTYTELDRLQTCPQNPHYHPEGSVWSHTLQVVDQAAMIAERNKLTPANRELLVLSALCHDLGKPVTTIESNGRICSPNHAAAGAPLSCQLLHRLHAPAYIGKSLRPLVLDHLTHLHSEPTARAIRRLAHRLQPASIEMWEMLVEADASGRAPSPPSRPAYHWLKLAQAMQQQHQPVAAIINGAILMEHAILPGKKMGDMLKKAYEAQLNGDFDSTESGREWLQTYLKQTNPDKPLL
ncbi:MAG: HD domain-containing protein [Mariprofundus sp.]|nr:HD domain-containing protein [Mariprofundus sp.]